MRQYEASRRPGALPPALAAVALTLVLASLPGCGSREPEAPPQPTAAPPPLADRTDAPVAVIIGPAPEAAPTAPARDPFAAVDVAADERLSQLLRLSDKPRTPDLKAQPAPRAPIRAPAPPPEPDRPERQPPPPAVPAAPAIVEAAPPAAAVAAPAPVAEPPRPTVLRAIERTQPPFPPEAQREGVVSGRVIAAITVQPNGSVSQVDIVEAVPPRVFDRAVRNTLLRWRFEPVAQQVRANVEVVFSVTE